ncbi:MAG: acylphosphatase [Candidatus Omnitrophica bacterium]|nr:acylphosphatase [Candidatus Omnitrophota bacterium]
MDKCYHIFFAGAVQGVGFRFTTRDLANRYRIKGWVKNLPDGRVEAIAKGEQKKLAVFLQDLKDVFGRGIVDCSVNEQDLLSDLDDFRILF